MNKYRIQSCSPERGGFRLQGEDEEGRIIDVVYLREVRAGDYVNVESQDSGPDSGSPESEP